MNILRKVLSLSGEIEEEGEISARIGVEEGVDAMVGGVAAAGFLNPVGCFEVDLLVRVIVVEVAHPGDEVPEHRRVREVNLTAELTVGGLGQRVISRVYGLELAAAAAQRGGAIDDVVAAVDHEPIFGHYRSVN